jgi:hypothetical protein
MVPWEEAEFLLVGHLATMKRLDPEISPYRLFLYPQRITEHLGHFRDHLVKLYEDNRLVPSPGHPREVPRHDTVKNILQEYPQFEPLYRDYKVLTNIYALQRSIFYLSASIDCIYNDENFLLVVKKAIQVRTELFTYIALKFKKT